MSTTVSLRRRIIKEVIYNEDELGINLKELYVEPSDNTSHDRKRKLPVHNNQKTNFGDVVKSGQNGQQDSCESSEEETEYDLKRKKLLEEREKMLRALGVTTAKEEVKEVILNIKKVKKEKKYTTKKSYASTRKSLPRRTSIRHEAKDTEGVEVTTESLLKISSRKPADATDVKFSDIDSEDFFDDYLCDLKSILTQNPTERALETDSLDRFKSRVQKLNLSPSRIKKVVQGRVTTAAVHPAESNLLVAAGNKYGNIGLWDVKSNGEIILFQPHSRWVNHVNFSVYSSEKLISSSLDGTVICGDLYKEVFTQIYSTDTDRDHTCWHTEMSRDVLLIAHVSGKVGVVDQREGKLSYTYKSVRTVHCHPITENYFVTGSGIGEGGIWDIRDAHKSKPKPVIDLRHPDKLTGCFFSPGGNYLLTTCYDDRLRVYDTSNFKAEAPKVIMKIAHNNHVARWLTPIRAKWHPRREDIFVIGSIMHPRRVPLYGINGKLVHEFMDPELQVILSVCEFHPTLPAFVGGSSSGRIYAFV